MIQSIKRIVLIITLSILTSSFILPEDGATKIFGVSKNDPSQIELVLEGNHHFTYRDYSDINNKVNVEGEWKSTDNLIKLIANDGQENFHCKWKITKDGKMAKSRLGMTFYSLIRLN